jgi:hypothetical protein
MYFFDSFKINIKIQCALAILMSILTSIFVSYMSFYPNLLVGIFYGMLSTMFIGLLYGIINGMQTYHCWSYYILYIQIACVEGINLGLCTSISVNILNGIVSLNEVNALFQNIFEIILCIIIISIISVIPDVILAKIGMPFHISYMFFEWIF